MCRQVEQGGTFTPDLPFHMVWLSTNACQLRCLHCSSNSSRRAADELTTGEVFRLIDQLADAGIVDFGISGGEPFIRDDIMRIVAYARRCGMAVGVASHGANFSAARADKLAELEVGRIQFSLDGLASSHDALRQLSGLHRRVLNSIETAKRAGLRVHVCCTINSLNVDHLSEFVEFLAAINIDRLNFSRFIPTGRGSDRLDISDRQWRDVIEHCRRLARQYDGRLEIVSHLAQQILVDDVVGDIPGFVGCQAGRGQGCVSANGTVFPCVLLPIPIGNIRETSFRQIWETSTVISELRERTRLEGKCLRCAVRAQCGGCRAIAYARTGRYLAEDPRCWLTHDHQPSADFRC